MAKPRHRHKHKQQHPPKTSKSVDGASSSDASPPPPPAASDASNPGWGAWFKKHWLAVSLAVGGTVGLGGGLAWHLSSGMPSSTTPTPTRESLSPEEEHLAQIISQTEKAVDTGQMQAAREGKPHVIIIPEAHYTPDCTFVQLAAVKRAKNAAVIVEANDKALKNFKRNYDQMQQLQDALGTADMQGVRIAGEEDMRRQIARFQKQLPAALFIQQEMQKAGRIVTPAVTQHITSEDPRIKTPAGQRELMLAVDDDLQKAVREKLETEKPLVVVTNGIAHTDKIREAAERQGAVVTVIIPKIDRFIEQIELGNQLDEKAKRETLSADEKFALVIADRTKAALGHSPHYVESAGLKTHQDAVEAYATVQRKRGASINR